MTDLREQLQGIRTFASLVKFLREELDWPIASTDDFEDLTFDYTPDELGIDPASATKIDEIKRLRPLAVNQPWGVFFVKFEPRQLPVVALRRILNGVVVKKRATASAAEQQKWATDDLLFISAYGEEEERRISFAHFSGEGATHDLPTLKVLAWDDLDTGLHLDDVAKRLVEHLSWPGPSEESDAEKWRERWGMAFELRYREVITTSQVLAERLATLARAIRVRILGVLEIESKHGPVTALMDAFRRALIHDLEADGFADMYAQTIAYGLLSARVATPSAAGSAERLPVTNPFLKELMETFLHVGDGSNATEEGIGIDFDELGVTEVVELLDDANMEAIIRDFGDRNPEEDPVIHFYEDFLAAYDKRQKIRRGVFYTPRPVVSYIVRSAHELLRTEFGLEDGLADTTTWSELAKRRDAIRIPDAVDPSEPFVQILDPATGTGTFLVEAIDLIYQLETSKWQAEGHDEKGVNALWNAYVPAHLLPRLHGYELQMAPYAIAHLKVGLKLYETGYRFRTGERVRIYLTNTLEPAEDRPHQLALAIRALDQEAKAVNAIKRRQRFTVVLGNPPYAGISANMSPAIIDLVEPYKHIDGVSLGERKIWVQDDYKKFIRFSQLRLLDSGAGIIAFITNHGFLDEPTSRGMRHSLIQTFGRILVLDLHGSLKRREVASDGSADENVFEIEPGVAISLFSRGGTSDGAGRADLWGLRDAKYDFLLSHDVCTTEWETLAPAPKFYLFEPHDHSVSSEFSNYVDVTEVFELGSNGIQTSRDHVVYGFAEPECRSTIEQFRATEEAFSTQRLRETYWPGKRVANYPAGDTRGWRVPEARALLRRDSAWESRFTPALYRPFDVRTLFFGPYMIDWPRLDVMAHLLRPNLSFCVGRAGGAADNSEWNVVFVANTIVDMNLFYRGGNVAYPLYITSEQNRLEGDRDRRPNLTAAFGASLSRALGTTQAESNLPEGVSPEDIFYYIYAVFFSPEYRRRYADSLRVDFPRVPLPGSASLFGSLAQHGAEMVAVHVMDSPRLNRPITSYTGPPSPSVVRVGWSDDTVWLDAAPPKTRSGNAGTIGFMGIPEIVWNFAIGGYRVCQKWLKDRKGRALSRDEIEHYQKIVVALHETVRIQGEIDEVIEASGGWPGAFIAADGENAERLAHGYATSGSSR